MKSRDSVADLVAAEMDGIMNSDEYRAIFAKPSMDKQAAVKAKPKGGCKCPPSCKCVKSHKDGVKCACSAAGKKKTKKEKKAEKLQLAINGLSSVSEVLESLNLVKSAVATLKTLETLISEAKKKAEDSDDKDDEEDEEDDDSDGEDDDDDAEDEDDNDADPGTGSSRLGEHAIRSPYTSHTQSNAFDKSQYKPKPEVGAGKPAPGEESISADVEELPNEGKVAPTSDNAADDEVVIAPDPYVDVIKPEGRIGREPTADEVEKADAAAREDEYAAKRRESGPDTLPPADYVEANDRDYDVDPGSAISTTLGNVPGYGDSNYSDDDALAQLLGEDGDSGEEEGWDLEESPDHVHFEEEHNNLPQDEDSDEAESVRDYLKHLEEEAPDELEDWNMPEWSGSRGGRTASAEDALLEAFAAAKKKLDPKAKVRNRGKCVFPAGSSKVKDNKDHFPITSEKQARNALAQASKYKSAPPWYKGSVSELVSAVQRAVKSAYPGIKATDKSKNPGKD